MDARRIDKRHFTHADDADFRLLADSGAHQLIKLCGDTEEERVVNLIDLHAGIDVEHLVMCGFRTFGNVKLLGVNFDLSVFHHTAQEEDYSKKEPHLDCDGQIEDDGQKEGKDKH